MYAVISNACSFFWKMPHLAFSIAIKGVSCPIWRKPMPASLHLKDAGIAHPDGSYREIFTEEELCEDGKGPETMGGCK